MEHEQFQSFWDKLEEAIDPEEDAIVDYPMNKAEEDRIQTMGRDLRPERDVMIF